MTRDPREDALAKAREALSACLNDTPGWPARCLEAIQRITALSAPPSQSESDGKWAAAAAPTSSHRRDYMIDAIRHRELITRAQALTPSPTPYVRPAESDWKCKSRVSTVDGPQDCDWPFCGCDPYANKVIEAIKPDEHSQTYVRPAADIRAEIEREASASWAMTTHARGYIAALTWTLTPPTQEPR